MNISVQVKKILSCLRRKSFRTYLLSSNHDDDDDDDDDERKFWPRGRFRWREYIR